MARTGVRVLFRTGSVYLLFSVLNRAIPFLLIPVLTRYIEPAGYGVISILGVVTAIMTPVIGLCGNSVLFQRYHKLDDTNRRLLISACMQIIMIGASAALAVGWLLSEPLTRYLGVPTLWVEVAIATAAFGMVTTIAASLFQIQMRPVDFGLLQAATALLNVGLTLLLVVALSLSWQGRLCAIALTALAMSSAAVYIMARRGDLDLSRLGVRTESATVIRLGGALIPGTIAGGMIAMSDRIFLTSMTNLETLGIYAVGVSIAQAADILLNSLAQAYLPYLYKHGLSEERHTRLRIVQGVYALVLISLVTALAVTLAASPIIDIAVGSRYHGAKAVVGWLALGFAFTSIGTVFQALMLVKEKNLATARVSVLTLMVNLIGNFLLIGELGMIGAAAAVALSSFTSMMLFIGMSVSHFKLPWFDRGVFTLRSSTSTSSPQL